jgi:hypothetical protein
MRKFLLLSGGSRWINLELVREITLKADDAISLRFDASDVITLEGKDSQECMNAVNQINGYEFPNAKLTRAA